MEEQQKNHQDCSAGWAVLWVGLVALALLEVVSAGLVEEWAVGLVEEGAAQTGFGEEARGSGENYKLLEKGLVKMEQFF